MNRHYGPEDGSLSTAAWRAASRVRQRLRRQLPADRADPGRRHHLL
jgi:hypothetical protein